MMIKKNTLLLLLTVLFCFPLFNQSVAFASESKKIVGVYPFQGINEEIKIALQSKITNELLKLNRVVVVDRKNEVAQLEMQKQRTEAFMNSEEIGEFGRQTGAEYVLLGTVTQGDIEKIEKTKKGETSVRWQVVVGVDLSIIDVTTGKILSSGSFTSMEKEDSRATVLNDCYTDIIKQSIVFLQNSFLINGKVVSATLDKKGNVNSVMLNIGNEKGVQKKQRYDLVEKKIINDDVYDDVLGIIEITEVNGENFSKARIISGDKENLKRVYEDPTVFMVYEKKDKVRK